MKTDALIDFVWAWLEQNPPEQPEPDHDGDNGHGFRVYCDSGWGSVSDEGYSFVAIKPVWAMYGK